MARTAAGTFVPLGPSDLASHSIEGVPLSQLSGEPLLARAAACRLPKVVVDEQQVRLILATLLASGLGVHPGIFAELREETRGLLLLGVRREGCVSDTTAAALNVVNQPPVVDK